MLVLIEIDPGPMLRLLFVCSRNQWRSPTAERVFRHRDGVSVRSRGLASSARRRLTEADLAWADLVFVMEEKHRRRILRDHDHALADTPVHVLDIPDDYELMDPELVELLEAGVEPFLAERDL